MAARGIIASSTWSCGVGWSWSAGGVGESIGVFKTRGTQAGLLLSPSPTLTEPSCCPHSLHPLCCHPLFNKPHPAAAAATFPHQTSHPSCCSFIHAAPPRALWPPKLVSCPTHLALLSLLVEVEEPLCEGDGCGYVRPVSRGVHPGGDARGRVQDPLFGTGHHRIPCRGVVWVDVERGAGAGRTQDQPPGGGGAKTGRAGLGVRHQRGVADREQAARRID